MAKYFDQLVNGPFDDPGLYVDLVFERRALLFDLGDISALAPRKLLRIAWARRFRKLHQFECYRP